MKQKKMQDVLFFINQHSSHHLSCVLGLEHHIKNIVSVAEENQRSCRVKEYSATIN